MPRVKFLAERIVQDEHRHDPSKQTIFKAGEVYDLSDASYAHWLERAPLELVPVGAPSLLAAPVSVAPAPSPPAGLSSFMAQPEEAALGEPPALPTADESPSAAEKSQPKSGGKPKG